MPQDAVATGLWVNIGAFYGCTTCCGGLFEPFSVASNLDAIALLQELMTIDAPANLCYNRLIVVPTIDMADMRINDMSAITHVIGPITSS
jgi:hypothetical protein